MAKIDISKTPVRKGTGYPPPYDAPCRAREVQALGLASGLHQFGVNLVRLKPGVWTGQRHWHSHEDEFVWVLEGTPILVSEVGRERLHPGECAAFPAGVPNAHHFVNEGPEDAVLLTVGTRADEDTCTYPDIDLFARAGRYKNPIEAFVHKDGTQYKR